MKRLIKANSKFNIFFLHGNCRSGLQEKQIFDKFNKRYNISFPNAPQEIKKDSYTWDNEELSISYLNDVINTNNVVLAGFSKGARTILRALYKYQMTKEIKGLILYAPGNLRDIDEWDLLNKNKNLPIVIIVGDKDDVSYEGSLKVYDTLKNNNYNVKLNILKDVSHAYPDNFEKYFNEALQYIENNI